MKYNWKWHIIKFRKAFGKPSSYPPTPPSCTKRFLVFFSLSSFSSSRTSAAQSVWYKTRVDIPQEGAGAWYPGDANLHDLMRFRNNTWRWKFTWGCGWGHFFQALPYYSICGECRKGGSKMGPGNSRGLWMCTGKTRLAVRLWAGISYMAYHCERNASTFPSLFSPQHHPMKHENELGVLASFLDLLSLISLSPHFWFLSFVLWFPFSVFFIAVFLLGSQLILLFSRVPFSLLFFFSLFGYSNGIEVRGWVVAERQPDGARKPLAETATVYLIFPSLGAHLSQNSLQLLHVACDCGQK